MRLLVDIADKKGDVMADLTFRSVFTERDDSWDEFSIGKDLAFKSSEQFTYHPTSDNIHGFLNEFADDGSAAGAYASLVSFSIANDPNTGIGAIAIDFDIPAAFFEQHVGTTISFEFVLNADDPNTGNHDAQGTFTFALKFLPDDPMFPFSAEPASLLQADFLGIERFALPPDNAAAEKQKIVAGQTTERAYVDGLLHQAGDTTIPAVAVEASMYDHVGTSAEITKLATEFLPPQIQVALALGLPTQVYACEALGLAFALGDEDGRNTFATSFGPGNPSMPNSRTGDTAFASAAATLIFGPDATPNTANAILGFVNNWFDFYFNNGAPGFPNVGSDLADTFARAAAWGDAVGVALANNLGLLPGRVVNFLEDAARGGAVYSAPLENEPSHAPFQGGIPQFSISGAGAGAANVELTGVPAPDHMLM